MRSDGSIFLRFSNYHTTPPTEEVSRRELDEEEVVLVVVELNEEEFVNPFACSAADAGQNPENEFKLGVFEEEELEDDDDDDEQP